MVQPPELPAGKTAQDVDLWGFRRGQQLVYLLIAAVLLLSVVLPRDWIENGPVLCLFRRATGLQCPGCGLTRSFVAAGHLDFDAAFSFHLFGPPFLFLVLIALLGRIAQSVWSFDGCLLPRGPLGSRIIRLALVLWLLWALVRIVSACL